MQILKKIPEYQLNILGILFTRASRTSGEVHNELEKTMNGKNPSRASVVNYLNRLVATHHVTYTEETGKGGYHRIYTLKGTYVDFTDRLTLQMNTQFRQEYLDPMEART